MSTTKMVLEFLGTAFISSAIGVLCDRLASWETINFFRKRKRDDGGVLLDKLKIKLLAVRPLLNDAEVKQWTDPDVKEWMDDIKHVLYQADDLQDEVDTKAMQSKLDSEFPITSSSSSSTAATTTTTHQDVTEGIELRIEAIIQKLEYFVNIAKDSLGLKKVDVVGRNNPPPHRLPQTSSLVDHDFVYGRDNDKEEIIQLLEDDSTGHRVSVIPIVGMGGIGKTTLAQLVYNDPKVDEHFKIKSWVCVSEPFDILRVTKSILEGLNLQTSGDNLDTLQVELRNGLSGKKFLIVLDDVWNENRSDWLKLSLPFGVGKHGSKIIVTTRHKKVASIMLHDSTAPDPIIDLRELSNEYCWQVFSKHAFGNASPILSPDIERIGKKIVKKCKGLPLAATTLGGMFHDLEVKEWESVLESHFWDLPKEKCDILPALMLSYHHLPSHLKRCFAFCAIIPKDRIFSKDELVPLWIALGFVEQPTDNRRIKDIGDGYFRELISRSLFQQSRFGDHYFLMHDLINDLAQFVAGKYCLRSDDGHPPDFSKVRYFSFSTQNEFFDTLKTTNKANNLRAIYSFTFEDKKVLHDSIGNLIHLRHLDLSYLYIKYLPDSIGNLIHLRHLDLSYSVTIECLLETICRLCNLETLLLKGCWGLTRLPTDLCKLIHLRHLDITDTYLSGMPMQIGRLTSLQCLTNFIVGNQNGSSISELRELRDLRGTLSISKLQNVQNARDALEANLNNKEHLEKLNLEWDRKFFKFEVLESQKEMEVLQNLEPLINLKHLTIGNYGGRRFPDWLGDRSFVNLKSLCLYGCSYCCKMPPLGQLPFLQDLTIEGMNSIVKVGSEFYGHDSAGRKPFQSLEILTFRFMLEWETWSILVAGEFCKLLELEILYCPKLNGEFPKHLPYLKKLEINECKRFSTLDWGLQRLPSLSVCKLKGECEQDEFLESFPEECLLPTSLTTLVIWDRPNMKSLNPNALQHLNSLATLEIINCPNLQSLPDKGLPSSLLRLEISGCPLLRVRYQREIGEDKTTMRPGGNGRMIRPFCLLVSTLGLMNGWISTIH